MGKWIVLGVGFCFLIVIAIPLITVWGYGFSIKPPEDGLSLSDHTVKVFVVSLNQILDMPLEEYIEGVVAAEMPASFGIEALKAQAVAARTFALKRMPVSGGSGCGNHPGADICTDHRHCQAWISQDELRERIGNVNYRRYSQKIRDAVESTRGLVMTYEGNLIEACYHSASGGATDNAEEVWPGAVPYLRGVSTEFEAKEPDFREENSFTMDDLEKKLGVVVRKKTSSVYTVAGKSVQVISEGRMDKPIEILEASKAGRVNRIRIGDKIFSGYDLRTLLGLSSTKMTYRVAGDKVYITTTGRGHGVGMSQYGANVMASAGKNFSEILSHYYLGVSIEKHEKDGSK
ncbi:MAG: stage II sporulation protein D [Firmicutes bacterium]|jgi:stage II sporulation protein D|nr:stage II sporulation protein D [Bacillota bacterium]